MSDETAAPDAVPQARGRPQLTDASARATAKASMAAGFPPPAQLAAQLGEAAIADIEAELAAAHSDEVGRAVTETLADPSAATPES